MPPEHEASQPDPHFHLKPLGNAYDREAMHGIRRRVFVEEQQVAPELEFDEHEAAAHHYIGRLGALPIACGRWRITAEGKAKIERCAVLPDYRGQGYGRALVQYLLNDMPSGYPVYLHAQDQAIPFYEALGFVSEGEAFYEAGILHRRMRWAKAK
jgi:predicted GNAT family N-acyltransferase